LVAIWPGEARPPLLHRRSRSPQALERACTRAGLLLREKERCEGF
jgi:hypothetical protein